MTHGVISAAQPEAAEAGALALMQGGNAVDAAIACALVQTVVDPLMCGIAGFGSMHLYLSGEGFHRCLDFHGRAPAKATPDMWEHLIEGETRDGFGFILKGRVNDVGYQSITAPGSLKAYYEAQTRFGRLDWAELLAPAIAYAEQGFKIRPHVHQYWSVTENMGRSANIERLRASPAARKIYLTEDGHIRPAGSVLKNPDMANTLRRIAEDGIEPFYQGDIAEKMIADIEANGGLLSREDLRNYSPREGEPLWGEYRGHRIASNPPPGGGVQVIEMLHILENFDLAGMGHNSPDYIRTVSEAMKRATVDKDDHVGDPMFFDVPLDRLLDKGYARQQAEAIKRGEKVHVTRYGANDAESRDTTQVSVIDAHGNAVSMTHSLGSPSGVVTEGLGFMYNGCMGVFDPRPGGPDSIAPGKSRFSSMAPSILFDGDEPFLVIGAPGGTYIAMGILQAILNVVDFGMTATEAVAAPRFVAVSDIIDVTNRIPRYITDEVEAMGYAVARSHLSYHFAGVHAILRRDGRWHGGADPGRDGVALEV